MCIRDRIKAVRVLADRLYFDAALEEDIQTKILSDTEVSDYASDRLYTIRREIRSLNERIRSRLAEYLTGEEGKYLQDGIVTMRDNRYVLPVRAEYKLSLIHIFQPFEDGEDYSYSSGIIHLEDAVNDAIMASMPRTLSCGENCQGIRY